MAHPQDVGTIIRLSHMTSHILFGALFVNVKNSAFLRQQLISANTDYEYSFLDATSVSRAAFGVSVCVLTRSRCSA
jgi:hypothetical protein